MGSPLLAPADRDRLVAAAQEVTLRAWCPGSGFQVGAAVLAADGRVFAGCNVESASYGLTICAERSAVCRAVAEGATELVAVAVHVPKDQVALPCGACRQVLAEFGPAMAVVLTGAGDRMRETTLDTLLPEPFTFRDLGS